MLLARWARYVRVDAQSAQGRPGSVCPAANAAGWLSVPRAAEPLFTLRLHVFHNKVHLLGGLPADHLATRQPALGVDEQAGDLRDLARSRTAGNCSLVSMRRRARRKPQ